VVNIIDLTIILYNFITKLYIIIRNDLPFVSKHIVYFFYFSWSVLIWTATLPVKYWQLWSSQSRCFLRYITIWVKATLKSLVSQLLYIPYYFGMWQSGTAYQSMSVYFKPASMWQSLSLCVKCYSYVSWFFTV